MSRGADEFVIRPARPSGPVPTRRSCEAAALLGVLFDEDDRGGAVGGTGVPPVNRAALHESPPIHLELPPGSVTVLTGPSGAGKSTALRVIASEAHARGWRVIDAGAFRLPNTPAVNQVGRDVEAALARLAHAGLAEASRLLRRPSELSEGECARLRLAIALDRVGRGAAESLIVIDEFVSLLDRATACSVAISFARAVRAMRGRAVLATAHEDVLAPLAPNAIVRFGADGSARVVRRVMREGSAPPAPAADRYDVVIGSIDDYRALAYLHHRSRDLAAPVRTIAARDVLRGEVVAALVVVMPTLNGAWRESAWPGRYGAGDKRTDARRLNREVRRIARVVVDPRHRGVGLATRLVRAYLDAPITARTEAVSALGRWSRFFERAGMRAVEMPMRPRDARMLDALAHLDIAPWRLAMPRAAWARVVAGAGESFMRRELKRWSGARGWERTLDFDDSWRSACRRLGAGMSAFIHESAEAQ